MPSSYFFFFDLEQAKKAGLLLGQYLTSICQKRPVDSLPGGIVKDLLYQPQLFSLAGLEPQPSSPPPIAVEESTPVDANPPTEELDSSEFSNHDPTNSTNVNPEIESTSEFTAG